MRANARECTTADLLRTRLGCHSSRGLGNVLVAIISFVSRRRVRVALVAVKPHRRNMFRRPAALEHPKIPQPPARSGLPMSGTVSGKRRTACMKTRHDPAAPRKCILHGAIRFAVNCVSKRRHDANHLITLGVTSHALPLLCDVPPYKSLALRPRYSTRSINPTFMQSIIAGSCH